MELFYHKANNGEEYYCAKKGSPNTSVIRTDGGKLEVYNPKYIKTVVGFKKVKIHAFSDESLGLIIDCLKQRIKQCKEMQASGIHRVQIPLDCEIREINQLIDYIKETFSDEND
jgi:hypothetical protein